ncbi:nucleotidyltransferase family protein [Anabaena sp. FACHB-709]|nr:MULTISPECIES: nucleotidyltransferase family protein [Nostocaceae]HBW32544.1 hypothetical protein [Nostoc sp. UBA8866]MBD2172121.1 nucleotidyltransferase family protein [Anabaena cylindrica FACHB-318]MBD2263689.1 nucleotidyltransferase family protein [Anabaena sp. FACHB-709]MBD2274725.1 nucleotidyltransferase family protein [Nostoc sp. PCC 7120 = FACHB-418]MBD2284785.1 nucleotidyltransferase family protein [Anabaena cylindrica FACHB-170]
MNNQNRLQMILADTPVSQVLSAMTSSRLETISQVNLPNWWLAGGAVRNTVWRSIFGNNCKLFIKDFDIAFFDEAGNREQELAAENYLTEKCPNYLFDVKNQASFARWRTSERPYTSTEEGIENWLHTATAVGVRLNLQGQWEFFTPYGLDDLFAGIIRPTPTHVHNPDAHNKAANFLSMCPCLRLAD